MEILSIGEKIKRARIYKGYTLKDLCDGKISISKMSCIENNKVSLDLDILEYIAGKLDIDIDYLKEDVEEQIIRNVKNLNSGIKSENYEKEMLYNFEVAENYELYDLAFSIIHNAFIYFLNNNSMSKFQNYISKYYELYERSDNEENIIIYNLDMGEYLFINKEYFQSINYYNNVRTIITKKELYINYLIKATREESRCYLMLKDYQKAYKVGSILLEYVNDIQDNALLAEMYHHLSIIMLRNDKIQYIELENKASEYFGDNYKSKAEAMYDYSVNFFEMKEKGKAVEYLKRAISLFSTDDEVKLTSFVLKNVYILIDNDEIELADEYCENSLNRAIDLNNDELIEKAYYYKSLILFKQNNYVSAEMYLNLSLDVLTKFGKKNDMYNRYMEIGNMYYKMGDISDSLKYFTLAISLEKKI